MKRREFVTSVASAGALAAAGLSPLAASDRRRRVALVGTGIRGSGFWVKHVFENYSDELEYVGLCDINPGRLEYTLGLIGHACPGYTDFDRMLDEAKPDLLFVTTVDSTHDEFIIKGLQRGMKVITEKPMTTDETKCQAILDAAAESPGKLINALNYRYGSAFTRLKEILLEGTVGRITSVDFNWYLNVYHGASYFRRWHGHREFGGTLLVHKAAHHFDLLNWFIDSDPVEVNAHGDLEHSGGNNAFRGERCMGCPHADRCDFYWDMSTR